MFSICVPPGSEARRFAQCASGRKVTQGNASRFPVWPPHEASVGNPWAHSATISGSMGGSRP